MLTAEGGIVTGDEKKAEVLNAFFASSFNMKKVVLRIPRPQRWKLGTGS